MSASAEIKYIDKPHPVTGVTNAKLALWVFLASEVMLFGGLFSAYLLLRTGNPAWPTHDQTGLSVKIGAFNTVMLICSSVTIVMAWASLKLHQPGRYKFFMLLTAALALVFFFVKIKFEYMHKMHLGIYPSTSTYYAIYYTMTGLHALHILGGVVVILYFVTPGAFKMYATEPDRFAGRVECTGLYWHFVDLVWIFLFPILYLMP